MNVLDWIAGLAGCVKKAQSEAVPPVSNEVWQLAQWERLGKDWKEKVQAVYERGWADRDYYDRNAWIEAGYQLGWAEGRADGILETVGMAERMDRDQIKYEGQVHLKYAKRLATKTVSGKAGYGAGYQKGHDEGYQAGRRDGYQVGYDEGRRAGRREGFDG